MTESRLHLCGKLVYSSTWKIFQNTVDANGTRAFMRHFLCGVGSDVVKTVTFETETKTLLKTSRPRLHQKSRDRHSRLQNMPNFFLNVVITSKMIFFKFLAFFGTVLVVSYLQIQQTKNRRIIEILLYQFFAIFEVSRPEAFETETETWNLLDRASQKWV